MKQLVTHEQLSDRTNNIVAASKQVVVVDNRTREAAIEFCKQIKSAKEKVEEVLGSQVKSAHAAWKTAIDMKNRFMQPLEQADKIVRGKITDFEIEMERVERKLQEEALLKQQLEEAKLQRSLDRKIKNAEKKGNTELVETLEEQRNDIFVPVEEIKPVLAEVSGKSSQLDYIVEVTDIKKLLAAVLSNDVPISLDKLVTVKVSVIKAFVRATGLMQVPGCQIKTTKIQRIL